MSLSETACGKKHLQGCYFHAAMLYSGGFQSPTGTDSITSTSSSLAGTKSTAQIQLEKVRVFD